MDAKPQQIFALFLLVIVSFIFWLQTTGRLGPIIRQITASTPDSASGGARSISEVVGANGADGPSPLMSYAAGFQQLGGNQLAGYPTVNAGNSSYHNAKTQATSAGYAALEAGAAGPVGQGFAFIGQSLGWRL